MVTKVSGSIPTTPQTTSDAGMPESPPLPAQSDVKPDSTPNALKRLSAEIADSKTRKASSVINSSFRQAVNEEVKTGEISRQEIADLPNQLPTLPELPKNIRNRQVNHNQLTALPELPTNLQSLSVQQNPLQSLPHLPATVSHSPSDAALVKNTIAQLKTRLETLRRNAQQDKTPASNSGVDSSSRGTNQVSVATGNFDPLSPDLLRRIATHIAPGTTDAASWALTSQYFSNLLHPRVAIDKEILSLEEGIRILTGIPELPELPELPETLQNLQVNRNQLAALPELPPNMQ